MYDILITGVAGRCPASLLGSPFALVFDRMLRFEVVLWAAARAFFSSGSRDWSDQRDLRIFSPKRGVGVAATAVGGTDGFRLVEAIDMTEYKSVK